jgi:hypothetical protein
METPISFSPTSDPSIVSVSGLSTDNVFVQALGLHIATHGKPNKAKYFQFSDGSTYDVIRNRGGQGGFILRAPRGTSSSAAPKGVDALAAYEQLDNEIKARRTQILSQLNTEIASLTEKLAKAEEARDQLLARAEQATAH